MSGERIVGRVKMPHESIGPYRPESQPPTLPLPAELPEPTDPAEPPVITASTPDRVPAKDESSGIGPDGLTDVQRSRALTSGLEEFFRTANENAPTAQELTERFMPSKKVREIYKGMLSDADHGKLNFDPVENLKIFAEQADSVDENGSAVVEVPLDGATSIGSADRTTQQKYAQQLMLVHSLGYDVDHLVSKQDGVMRLRITRPTNATPSRSGYFDRDAPGRPYIDRAPATDKNGERIAQPVVEALRSANFIKDIKATNPNGFRLSEYVKRVADAAKGGSLELGINDVYSGGMSLYANVAKMLGYVVGDVSAVKGSLTYVMPIQGRRPGFRD